MIDHYVTGHYVKFVTRGMRKWKRIPSSRISANYRGWGISIVECSEHWCLNPETSSQFPQVDPAVGCPTPLKVGKFKAGKRKKWRLLVLK
ncbi:hypothetical protein C0Q70_19861 [Pomacea canaliculata]|uniref:Uncharacterized protein n=1 Tax=Pomacea canaliculata TaxID=400727 RepID=A0A2T7NDX5_POMCA|nr:hypothetical protein C0Q70_19861 [Pomacea canaliculata]